MFSEVLKAYPGAIGFWHTKLHHSFKSWAAEIKKLANDDKNANIEEYWCVNDRTEASSAQLGKFAGCQNCF